MDLYLSIAQIVVAILLGASILLQQRGTALGSAFGGDSGNFYSVRRGILKKLYWATIVLSILFVGLALVQLLI